MGMDEALRGAEQAVRALFDAFLDREPSEAELVHFTAKFESRASILELIQSFYVCDEYTARRKSAGKLFVPPGHFYSPIVSPPEVTQRIPHVRPATQVRLPDVRLDLDEMTAFWESHLAPIAARNSFPVEADDAFRYRFNNPAYSYADAIMLEAMILHFRPRHIIEVGSGWSTACILDVLARSNNMDTTLTCIEPFPSVLKEVLRPGDETRIRLIDKPVQSVDKTVFTGLGSNDILLIDSTHIVKTGSDVVFELTEVLPVLKRGVVIHFHDIFYPFEYPYQWVVVENRSWNEIYALRNFLAFNNEFGVIFFNDMFAQLREGVLRRDCPKFLLNPGGSLWLQRSPRQTAAGI